MKRTRGTSIRSTASHSLRSTVIVLLLALSAGFLLSSCAQQATSAAGADASSSTESATSTPSQGTRQAPIIYRPAGLSMSRPVPLVIGLHASGGSPSGFQTVSGLDAVADRHGFVVAYLGSLPPASPAWRGVDKAANLAYISSEITQLTASENIDPRRVYVTGFSAGATMSFIAGCQLSSQIDGIAPVSGAMRFTDSCTLSHPLSELLVIGTDDRIPIAGSARLLSADQVASLWRGKDGCSPQSTTAQAGPVAQTSWSHCSSGTGVGLYVVSGGTHQWPGGPGETGPDAQYDAASAVWDFFASHPAPTTLVAKLESVRVRGRGRHRTVHVTLTCSEPVHAVATLARRGRTIASKRLALRRGKHDSLTLRIPVHAPSARYQLRLILRDSSQSHLTLRRRITIH